MKNITLMKKLILYVGIWVGNITPAWAATNGREDNSNLFVGVFLGFCALIVVAQLIPAMMVLFGVAKGIKKETVKVAPETVKILND
jgi:cadmium resistance protein CadD (predicted permease)